MIIWAIVGFVMYKGVSKGIETICKICLPILMLLTVILVVRGITLPGAVKGLEYMFKPDWSMFLIDRMGSCLRSDDLQSVDRICYHAGILELSA
ncbi:MAG: hypothetical protein V8R14_06770 [Clostridia bacterium]